jgi:hypothetical protein
MSKNDLIAPAGGTAAASSEWDVRGHLAASLTCWHRLTGKEADELVAMFQGRPAQATQQAEPVVAYRFPKAGINNGYNYVDSLEGEEPRFYGHWEALCLATHQTATAQAAESVQRDALPTIKGASITGGYVVVTPAGWGNDKAAVLRDAILRTFPVNPAFSPKPDDAALATKGGA